MTRPLLGGHGDAAVARAFYGGIGSHVEPDSDADALNEVAAWLDKVDDVTEFYLRKQGVDEPVPRAVQARLRRIADRIEPSGFEESES